MVLQNKCKTPIKPWHSDKSMQEEEQQPLPTHNITLQLLSETGVAMVFLQTPTQPIAASSSGILLKSHLNQHYMLLLRYLLLLYPTNLHQMHNSNLNALKFRLFL
jgi:hypothetical protein